ncbi:rRNA methyltransferase 1, mitochondrial [Vitis vinifera]|uniref:rRNA methyltransferase 1, mitochondrial n=1 Tax=Vitis vinifera TaxID=29760 RepID=A0A438DSC5_VITVI|nr:rRNA methyltransferase 1, mitochondrial [Vitis vinifera]
MRTGKALPWLTAKGAKERKSSDKVVNLKNNQSYWEKSAKRSEKVTTAETSRSSWEESAERFGKNHSSRELLPKNGTLRAGTEGSKNIMVDMVESQKNGYMERDESAEEEMEVIDDPRWDKIKNRYTETGDVKGRYERPELRRWNKQENWGRKTWKEATESTIPKIVGEGIYGVGPVLAALSAGRREFYALYVQEGLDLSGNNRKKKDKKGFEKGLVLDASPLEMVKIKELDPVLTEGEKGPLWVALDENSAPLSGVVSKASAGSLELMELRFCKNMMQFLTSSAENGWQVLGGSVSPRAIPLNEISPGAPTILVLGSEGTGLRPLVERSCTQLIRIPGNIPVHVTAGEVEDVDTSEMDRRCLTEDFQSFLAVESLNVSVAAGVLLHHLVGNSYENNCLLGDKQVDALQ